MVACDKPVLDLQQLHYLIIDTILKFTSLVLAKLRIPIRMKICITVSSM